MSATMFWGHVLCRECGRYHNDLSECAEIECKRKALRAKDGRNVSHVPLASHSSKTGTVYERAAVGPDHPIREGYAPADGTCHGCGQDVAAGKRVCSACEGGDTPNWLRPPSHKADAPQPLTGGSSDYYKLQIDKPTSGGDPYTAECNDIIEALQMTYAEGNVFKAVWRHALARRGVGKKGNTLQYEADKVAFFGERLAELAKD